MCGWVHAPAVCKAYSEMQNMSLLGSLGPCPRKFLKNACSEIESGTF